MTNECSGEHRYYVADVAIVEAEGSVTVIALCTGCGHFIHQKFSVATQGNPITKGNNNVVIPK